LALSTKGTFLMVKAESGGTWTKLCDIVSYPDLGATPPRLDATTQSDTQHVYIAGLPDPEESTFEVNHTADLETSLATYIDTEKEYSVWFGASESAGVLTPTGSDGKYNTSGKLYYYATGGGVDEVRKGQISIIRSKAWVRDTTTGT
jgi:hypothetical protein